MIPQEVINNVVKYTTTLDPSKAITYSYYATWVRPSSPREDLKRVNEALLEVGWICRGIECTDPYDTGGYYDNYVFNLQPLGLEHI